MLFLFAQNLYFNTSKISVWNTYVIWTMQWEWLMVFDRDSVHYSHSKNSWLCCGQVQRCFCLLKNYFLIHSKYLCGMPMLFDQCSENGWRLLAEPVSITVIPKKLSQHCNSCLCVVVRFSFSNMDWMLDSCSVNVAMWTSLKGARSNAQY